MLVRITMSIAVAVAIHLFERADRFMLGFTILASIGIVIGIISLVLGFSGWTIVQQWLYLLGSALLILIGIQLMISWILVQILDDISQREALTKQDLTS